MATRLYYSNATGYYGPPLTGLPKTVQGETPLPNRLVPTLATSRPTEAATLSSALPFPITSGESWGLAMFATPPLAAGLSIAGTVKGQMRVAEGSASANDSSELYIFLVDSSWAYKSTLLSQSGPATNLAEWVTTTLTNRALPYNGAVAITTQTAVTGDRIVALIGTRRHSTSDTLVSSMAWASAAASDLPEDSTTTTDLAPWIEFSADLTFGTDTFPPLPCTESPNIYELSADISTAFSYPPSFAWQDPEPSTGGGPAVPTTGQIWPRGNQ